MSAAGTPSTDPWVVLARERARYEDQFRSLKPVNGVVTGEQAKGFFLQSQLPPLILGQIWALADTDSDGRMDINEFSIACKLINLKLRGFEVPTSLPPALLASLKVHTPPAIPPLPTQSLVDLPPARPDPPKIIPNQPGPPLISNGSASLIGGTPVGTNASQTLIPNLMGMVPPMGGPTTIIPTGIVPPMQSNISAVQPLIGGIPPVVPPIRPPPQPVVAYGAPLISGMVPAPQPIVPPPLVTAVSSGSLGSTGPMSPGVSVHSPGATSTPRASVTSLERTGSIDSTLQSDWAVPHQTKLKYTQIFNTTDRTRSGFLSGAQARNVMVQTKLPQNILAQIWALADMDADGRLGCEEFVLAMHLCEQAQQGHPPPTKLPPDLVPPSFRRPARTASISSQGSAPHVDLDPASTLLQSSFEDKRKENYEKGQAELERRRKTLLDQQKKEAEERERKEREEIERREKARQEAERKRMEELEKQMREQQERERLIEEERRRQAEQKEAARKEMERQRQLEWEKQRLQELQQQRQREQENVLRLKARNQSLTIELSTLNEQVRELSQKICDTRMGVSNVKTTIDGMRSTRDSQMQEMSQLKNKLKDQNARLLALSQEKVRLDAKNKMNAQDSEQTKVAYENREINIKNLREKISDIQAQLEAKSSDIENNNSQLEELKTELRGLLSDCERLYAVYEEKRDLVVEMKNANRTTGFEDAWKSADAWGASEPAAAAAATDWPADNWGADPSVPADIENIPGVHKYRAVYEFVARNNDEISFQPGDIIHVPEQQTGEPGWLAGEIRGKTGWFPESYVEPLDGVGIAAATAELAEPAVLEEIAEVPEAATVSPPAVCSGEPEYYVASYPYQSQEPGDLTFNAGDTIAVYKKEGDWWTGKLGDAVGIFPSNYVQKMDAGSGIEGARQTEEVAPAAGVSAAEITSALENITANAQVDNEVSQITENKISDRPPDAGTTAGVQVMKGKKPEIASVIAPYQASSPEQLSLARGQLIMIRKKTDSGWWEGELQAKGRKRQVGWFPASYVKVLNSSGKISGRSTPVSTTRMQQEVVIDKVVALYAYTAANPDELSFLKDDIINVTAREEEAWWRGELNGVSGLFPSNYVAPLQQQYSDTSSVGDKKRREHIREFVETERAYVHDMAVVHEVFELPLRKSRLISAKEIDEIFVNWRDILVCNENFLADLDAAVAGAVTVGDVICRHLPRMTAYITFCGKQLDSAVLLQQLTESSTAFRELVKRCQNNVKTKGMPLSSFLIKPMQRITRYPLLIAKILEHTPDNHPDYEYLREARRIAERFLNGVNENVRLKENSDRLEWLQQYVQTDLGLTFNGQTNRLGPRQLLHFGTFAKLKSGKELLGFLFNDFLMLVQPSKGIGTQFSFQRNHNVTYKMYKQPILVRDLSASRGNTDNVESNTDWNRVLKLQDDKAGYKISLLASTVHECTTWSKKIDAAREAYAKIDNLNKQNKRKTRKHGEKVYCKVTLGSQEQDTDFGGDGSNNGNATPGGGAPQAPHLVWNYSMQFQLRNLGEESLVFVVLEHNPYGLDEFLGRAELKLAEVCRESRNTNGPIVKKLILHQVESGEIVVKLDLHMFNTY
ncbi:intersectin-2 isoform X2 [Cylas formicarius]|uniref:intersectin-2 isoform X2 n=1 Tax=Cylas formicarius TaxID=197179 RepID=UPI00295884FE|nr:intersectin-2 isoform X2 [Cylas formicarius]